MTVLIVGGAYQGKKNLAKKMFGLCDNDFADGACCTWAEIQNKKAIYNLHEYIKNNIDVALSPKEFIGKIIITNEIGCGVVPIDNELNSWREQTGRLCCEIAQYADIVLYVSAGLPIVLKGTI